MDYLEELRRKQSLTIIKQGQEDAGSVSVAVSYHGNEYYGGSVVSDSKILHVSSEQLALSCAKNRNDMKVNRVVTLLGARNDQAGILLAFKVIVDFALRINGAIAYEVFDSSGKKIVATEDVRKEIPFYHPKIQALTTRLTVSPESNSLQLSNNENRFEQLKKYALEGVARNFPAYDSASGYGVAVYLEDGTIVFGGQYSSLEGRLGLHAEMSVVLDVCMNFPHKKILDLAVVSSKFPNSPCMICGHCLQFLSEMSARYTWDMALHCFASETSEYSSHSLETLLPFRWSSKKG